jgi:glutamine synthetase type III
MDERPPLVAEIEEIIRRYLQAHPKAVDTERGIREWWVRKARRTYAVSDVRAAIEALVATGELAERRLPDGQFIYASAGTPPSHNS